MPRGEEQTQLRENRNMLPSSPYQAPLQSHTDQFWCATFCWCDQTFKARVEIAERGWMRGWTNSFIWHVYCSASATGNNFRPGAPSYLPGSYPWLCVWFFLWSPLSLLYHPQLVFCLPFLFTPVFVCLLNPIHLSLYYCGRTVQVNSWMLLCSLSLSLLHKYLIMSPWI